MKIVRPSPMTDALLLSSNVAEETQWNSGTSFALAAVVRGTGEDAHSLFLSAVGSNLNNPIRVSGAVDLTKWTPYGVSNRWRQFDGRTGVQTTNPDIITQTFQGVGRINTIGLQNVNAQEVRIKATDPVDGVVYDKTRSLVSTSGIRDPWAYTTEPILRVPDLSVTDLPALYSDLLFEVTLTDPGQTVGIGECIPGFYRRIGGTRWSPQRGFFDFSTKQANALGDYDFVERGFSKRAAFQVIVEKALVDTTQDMFEQYRSTPLLFIGDDNYSSTQIFGFLQEQGSSIDYDEVSMFNIQIEGL